MAIRTASGDGSEPTARLGLVDRPRHPSCEVRDPGTIGELDTQSHERTRRLVRLVLVVERQHHGLAERALPAPRLRSPHPGLDVELEPVGKRCDVAQRDGAIIGSADQRLDRDDAAEPPPGMVVLVVVSVGIVVVGLISGIVRVRLEEGHVPRLGALGPVNSWSSRRPSSAAVRSC